MKANTIIIRAIAVLFLISGSVCPQTRKADVATFQLGDQLIAIPAPNGFEEAASQFERIKSRFTATEAPANDMLAVHLPHEYCEKLRAGEMGPLIFYTKISVLRAARDSDYSVERFEQLKSDFRKTGTKILDVNSPAMKETLERLGKSLTELNKEETQVDMSQPLNLGEFGTQPNVFSLMLVVNFKAQTSEGEVNTLLAGAMSCIRVKQRLLFVYTYRKYESKADVETLRDFTKQWIGQILAAN